MKRFMILLLLVGCARAGYIPYKLSPPTMRETKSDVFFPLEIMLAELKNNPNKTGERCKRIEKYINNIKDAEVRSIIRHWIGNGIIAIPMMNSKYKKKADNIRASLSRRLYRARVEVQTLLDKRKKFTVLEIAELKIKALEKNDIEQLKFLNEYGDSLLRSN